STLSSSQTSPQAPKNESNNYFKSAQWSPDGTSILTSSADHTLRTFILPPDLLAPPHPHPLTPYSQHPSPEPLYATTFHPSYNLQEPSTCLALTSPRSLPIRLFSPFTGDKILASYPLVSPRTEAWIAPHSLLCHPSEGNTFFAGSECCVSVFDASRDGEGPVTRMYTTPSRRRGRGAGADQGQGMKGIVSALGVSSEGMLAAGTYSRWVGLYDGFGKGGSVGVFCVGGVEDAEGERGGGITQVIWSDCGRYLCVAERASDGVGVWDIRGTGKRLAWLRGRKARTQQRLGVEVMGGDVWAGGVDGVVRVWDGLGMVEGMIDPSWDFRAHEDAISSTTLHSSGSVLATCSGQR
ncbi:WD40-repeat-containing domain protein, partial [Usnea florida]